MGTIGYGYGSEWHMMRYLGRHRDLLTATIASRCGCSEISWLDFLFDRKDRFLDAEWKGLDFLTGDQMAVRAAWEQEWPQTGNVMNWDAVGWASSAGPNELILVEAKSHLGEINSKCKAKEIGGLPKIRRFLDRAKIAFGVPSGANWLQPHYQYCNRLATLNFLRSHGIPTHLVFIYFTGDSVPGTTCPQDEAEWGQTLTKMKAKIQIPQTRPLEHIHEVFLPVVR